MSFRTRRAAGGLGAIVCAAGMMACSSASSRLDAPSSRRVRASALTTNTTLAQATPIAGDRARLRGNIFGPGVSNFFSFTGLAGDYIYAATQTSFAAGDGDTVLAILDSSGNVVESDDNEGSFTNLASSLAGTVLPGDGTYYLQVSGGKPTSSVRPYDLYFRRERGQPIFAPMGDYGANNPVPLPAGGWVDGELANMIETNAWSFTVNAGDTIFASLDLRYDTYVTLMRLMVYFPDGSGLVAENPGGTTHDSQAAAITVREAGTYILSVDQGPSPYAVSVTVFPAEESGCVVHSATVGTTLAGKASVSGTIAVPEDVSLGDVQLDVDMTANFYKTMGLRLTSPQGTSIGLVGKFETNAYNAPITATFDDDAALPVNTAGLQNHAIWTPEPAYRMHWLDGQSSLGTWTVTVDDSAPGAVTGTLDAWTLTLCPRATTPSCPAGWVAETRLATDFEADDGGFTHSGTADSWARGTPNSPPIVSCHSGTQCWKTNLTGAYPDSSSADLTSPSFSLDGLGPPIYVEWWQMHNMEDALADHAYVDAIATDNSTSVRLFEHVGPTMVDTLGTPTIAGWSDRRARIDALQGHDAQLVFHLDSDSANAYEGLVIDDVTVTGCRNMNDMAPPPDMTSPPPDMTSPPDMTPPLDLATVTDLGMVPIVDLARQPGDTGPAVGDMRASVGDLLSATDQATAPSANDLAREPSGATAGGGCTIGGRAPSSPTPVPFMAVLVLACLRRCHKLRRQRQAYATTAAQRRRCQRRPSPSRAG
ncbi:MAG TPA: proprotein convertase P-domain-containing protein [Polyangia bacterium]